MRTHEHICRGIRRHRRRPTSRNTNVGKCAHEHIVEVFRRPIFPQFPVVFVLPDTNGQSAGCVIAIQEPYPIFFNDTTRSVQVVARRCNPWARRLGQKVGLGSKFHTTSSLQFCVAAQLLRLTLRSPGNKISEHLNNLSMHASWQIARPCFCEPHAQTVEDLFPSSVVAAQTTTLG